MPGGRADGALTDDEFAKEVGKIAAALGMACGTLEGLKVCGKVDEADTMPYAMAEQSLRAIIRDRFAWSAACEGRT